MSRIQSSMIPLHQYQLSAPGHAHHPRNSNRYHLLVNLTHPDERCYITSVNIHSVSGLVFRYLTLWFLEIVVRIQVYDSFKWFTIS